MITSLEGIPPGAYTLQELMEKILDRPGPFTPSLRVQFAKALEKRRGKGLGIFRRHNRKEYEIDPPTEDQATAARLKPPLGICPKWLHDDTRQRELILASARYFDAGIAPDFEWLEELHALLGPYLEHRRAQEIGGAR